MKVGLVLGTSVGGVGQHVRSLVQRLPRLDCEVVVLGPASTEREFRFSGHGVEFREVDIAAAPRLVSDARTVWRLRAILRDLDLVHAHGLRAAAFAGLALGRRRPGRTPLVATWHNAVLASGWRRVMLTGLERLAARRADITLGASSDLVGRARRLGATTARVAAVAAPAMASVRRARDEVRAELGVGEQPLVLAIGRLAPQKDYATMLRAAQHLAAGENPVPLIVVAGDGPLRAELQSQIDGRNLPVRLLGHRDDVPDLMAAADVYLLTSRWEARALVIQEAFQAGLPVVATAVGGIPQLVDDAALLVPPGDDRALAREIRRLLASPQLREEYAERGRRIAETWPDEDDTAREVLAVYAEALRH